MVVLIDQVERLPRGAARPVGLRPWYETLRALREARGATQEGWAARLGVSRKTVQRWERGDRAPDPGAEAAIIGYCREARLLRAFGHGPLRGLTLTEEGLRDLFAEARWRGPRAARRRAAPDTAAPDGTLSLPGGSRPPAPPVGERPAPTAGAAGGGREGSVPAGGAAPAQGAPDGRPLPAGAAEPPPAGGPAGANAPAA